jgi:DGQHR domain-containing protein
MAAKKRSVRAAARVYQALRLRQRGTSAPELVLFVAPVKDILSFAKVNELSPSTRGPQREHKEARVQAIARFLAADKTNTIPTAVVLAFGSGSATFKSVSSKNVGLLRIKADDETAATIVDGQHRLTGINETDPDMEVAVVALLDANEVERAFQFLVINNKASKVPASHTKALLAKYKDTSLASRLRSARLAFDVDGIKDVDLVNSDKDSPFFKTIDWTTTPKGSRMVQATAIELSLDYLGGLGVPEYEDRDVRRSVFLTIWKTIRSDWKTLWKKECRLISKVGIVCLTRFIADRITNWADSDELNIEVTDLGEIETQTRKIIQYMDQKFWTTPWAEKAQGGFDTNQGRERIVQAITQLYRNGKRQISWYTDIEIIDRSLAKT